MWIGFVFFAMLSMFVWFSGSFDYLEREKGTAVRQAKVAGDNFRVFAWAAWVYMQENPAANGVIGWTTIKTASNLPDSVKSASLNPNWKIVADGAGKWTVCAEMPEGTASAVNTLVPDTAKRYVVGDKMVFAKDSTEAATEAAKCN